MRKEKLSELLDISIGRTPSRNVPTYWGKGHRWASIRDLSSKIVTETKEQITDIAVKEARCKMVPKGTLLFSFKLTIGKMAFAGCDLFTNEAIAAFSIKDERELNSEFLYYALQSATFGGSNQAVMGKTLNSKSLAEIEIPLPPLRDQVRIAHLIGKVERLIALRKQHLQQLDDLLKSVFLEMFGDPVRNERGWEPGTSSIYAEMVTVGVVVKPASHYVVNGVIALRSLNIKPNRIDLDDVVYFSQKANDGVLSKSRLKANDVVVVRTGKTGTAAVVPASLDGANCIDLIVVRPRREQIHPQYLACLLNSERGMALVSSLEVGGIQKHFNVGALNKIPFPLPPIDLQNQFALIVEKIEGIKIRYQQSLTDLESLYGTLSKKAFEGELDLSRIASPTVWPTEMEGQHDADLGRGHASSLTQAPISLPELPASYSLARPNERKKSLEFWFDHYLSTLPDDGQFSEKSLVDAVNFRLVVMDDDRDFSVDDYDIFKVWVYANLSEGRLQQRYADEDNHVTLTRAQAKAEAR